MWVFGYGSLIWDGWEKDFGCVTKIKGKVSGYRRTFNKGSVVNWGTSDNPCPTLGIIKDENKYCEGIAFEFPDQRRQEILSYLNKREGTNFELKDFLIQTTEEGEIQAFIPVYTGKNIIPGKTTKELADMVRNARGTSGNCSDYIRKIAAKLQDLGIEDEAVTEFNEAIEGSPTG